MTWMNYSTQKIVVPIMIVGLGNTVFCEATKVDMAESEDKRQKNHFQKKKNQLSSMHFQALCVCFAHFLKISDVLLNCMKK